MSLLLFFFFRFPFHGQGILRDGHVEIILVDTRDLGFHHHGLGGVANLYGGLCSPFPEAQRAAPLLRASAQYPVHEGEQ